MLVQIPSGAVERSASARPSGSGARVDGDRERAEPLRGLCDASVSAPSDLAAAPGGVFVDVGHGPLGAERERDRRGVQADRAGPAPPTTSTAAPGSSASGGATARQASAMLSEALARAAGATPSGSGTSMWSA